MPRIQISKKVQDGAAPIKELEISNGNDKNGGRGRRRRKPRGQAICSAFASNGARNGTGPRAVAGRCPVSAFN